MTEWDIQSRSVACTGCHQPFADQQSYHTLLALGTTGYAAGLGDIAKAHPGVIIGSYPQFGEGRFKNQIVVRSKDADSLHAAAAAVREMLAKILAAQGA